MICSSSNRCRSTSCDTCRWRYAGHIARRIVSHARRFFNTEINIGDANFRTWASRVRNVIEYRRGQLKWWNEVNLNVWLCRDYRARGIVGLGSTQEAELIEAFERWPTTLKPTAPENVRAEIYRVLNPNRIAMVHEQRRYQSISFNIGTRTLTPLRPVTPHEPIVQPVEIAAMPCVLF